MNTESTRVKQALTPQKGGFLASGFSHTLNLYKGCGFGRTGCPFCYVRESPVGRFGPTGWGEWVIQKVNIAEVLEKELHKPKAREFRIFMSSATDPYQPAEAQAQLSRKCLEVFQAYPVGWLVVQTRSLLACRDFNLLSQMPFVTLSVSIETDLLGVHQRFTRSSAVPERRMLMVQEALAHGIHAQIVVAPIMPYSPAFGDRLALAVGDCGRIIIDTFYDGDGSGGVRSARLGMSGLLADAGFPGWFERCREHARALQERLRVHLGTERVLWSAEGFGNKPPRDNVR